MMTRAEVTTRGAPRLRFPSDQRYVRPVRSHRESRTVWPRPEERVLREVLVTRDAVPTAWHVKMALLGLVTGGLAWFWWPVGYALKRRVRTESVWELR